MLSSSSSSSSIRIALFAASLLGILGSVTLAAAQSESTIFNFSAVTYAGLAMDSSGSLYGTDTYGGKFGHGNVYQLSLSGGVWQETSIYDFTGGADGATPEAAPIFDKHGNLYGTTAFGGANGQGTVFKLTPTASGSWDESVLYSFTGKNDGGVPGTGNLVFDNAGNLYGSNVSGANQVNDACGNTGGCGVIFRLSPIAQNKWKFNLLHTFNGGADGIGPAQLAFDKRGTLFGSAAGAWSGFELPNQPGSIFTLTPTSSGPWKDSIVYQFGGGTDGGLPGSLTFDNAGNIYGTGADGGIIDNCWSGYGPMGCGVVFKLSSTAGGKWKETPLYSFTGGTDGSGPQGSLVFINGRLYGVAFQGGANNLGAVYKLSPVGNGTWTESVVHSFDGTDGALPNPPIVVDSLGNLFGTTRYGGSNSVGVVFEVTP